jgi:hypothetical protein
MQIQERLASGAEGEGHGFARDAFNKGADKPSDDGRDIASERDGFELDVRAAVAFEIAPVCVQAPEVAAVVADGLFGTVGLVMVFDLGDARGNGACLEAVGVDGHVEDVMLGVVDGSDPSLLFVEAEEHFEVVAVVFQDAALHHVGFVDFRMVVVLLGEGNGLLQRDAGDEYRADPMMDKRVAVLDGLAVVQGFHFLDDYFAAAQVKEGRRVRGLGEGVHPEKRVGFLEFGVDARFREADVAVKGFDGFLLELGGRSGRSQQAGADQRGGQASQAQASSGHEVTPIPDSRRKSVAQRRRQEKAAASLFNALDAFGWRMTVLEGKAIAKRKG